MERTPLEPSPIRRSRGLERVIPSQPASDGAGVRLRRNLGPDLHQRLDPFLLLDEFGSDRPGDYIAGFPDHPHRGFETVTYMLDGAMRHEDSHGNTGHLRSGSVQWMKAARGVIHSEMPEQEAGLMRGFQLWINLPAAEKMDDPSYQDLSADEIPQGELPSGAVLKLIAGRSHGMEGPAARRTTDPLYVDIALPDAVELEHALPKDHHAFIYVYEGEVTVGADDDSRVTAGHLGVLGDESAADGVSLRATGGPARLLLLAALPLHETVVQYGPFVMNTKDEIEQAFLDYRSGRLTN